MVQHIVIFLAVVSLSACVNLNKGANDSQSQIEDPNYKDGIYVNNHIDHPEKSFFSFMRMRFFGDEKWHDPEKQKHLIPQQDVDIDVIEKPKKRQVTWLGHSTFLIQHDGVNILTDPIFSNRASPFSFAGPKRYTRVPAKLSELPKIDYVIISHNHYDHLDEASIKILGNQPIYFVPSNLQHWFLKAGIDKNRVIPLKWWEKVSSANNKAVFTAMPSQHWSARGLNDRNETHWASWLIELNEFTFWFAGDTGYNNKDFNSIGDYVESLQKSLDLALIPIGAYAPRWFMKTYHVNTQEAVQIHHDIKAKLSLGMHWGTFPMTAEPAMEPYENLQKIKKQGGIKEGTDFKTLKIGESYLIGS